MALIIFILHVQEAAARFTKAPKSAGITTTKKDRNAQTIAHATQVRHVVLQPPKEGQKCTDHCACYTGRTSIIITTTKRRTEMHRPLRMPHS